MVNFGVILDIDDTLYLERDYVRSGFSAVAESCAVGTVDPAAIFDSLWGGFEQGVRGNAFDRLLEAFPEVARHCTVADLVTTYRSHQPQIELLPDAAALLRELSADDWRSGVISDGPARSQAAKVAALGLEGRVDTIVLTGAWGDGFSKPHERAYHHVATELGLGPEHLAYVADNPAKDFVTPNRLGWLSIRIRRPGQLHYAAAAADPAHHAQLELTALDGVLPSIAERST